jgi:thiol:disulfide interchange protein
MSVKTAHCLPWLCLLPWLHKLSWLHKLAGPHRQAGLGRLLARRWVSCWLGCCLVALALAGAKAQAQSPFGEQTFLKMEEAYKPVVFVQNNHLVIDWQIAEGYFLYRDKFQPTAATADATYDWVPRFEPGEMKFDPYFNKDLEVYHNHTRIQVPLEGVPPQFELKLKSQGCAEAGLCYPPRTQYFSVNSLTGEVVESAKSTLAATAVSVAPTGVAAAGQTGQAGAAEGATGSTTSFSLATALLFALLGGMLLNLMPCVFPVLSLKAFSFAQQPSAGASHAAQGWAYTLGVVLSFAVVAAILLGIRQAGNSAGWGFQLQSPIFVAAMLYLFLVMGLSLSGVVAFGTRFMGLGQGLTQGPGLKSAFFTGVLAAVVASPCTGPLMAPALGFALTQSAPVALLVFVALGLGLALPFLALSLSPALAKALPAPGHWMTVLKQFLAFPMYISVVWLLYVLGNQVSMTGVFFVGLGAVALVFALWLMQNQPERPLGLFLVRACAALALGAAIWAAVAAPGLAKSEGWQVYSPERVQTLREQGQPVFVDFTADWCITCKVNEATAINRADFAETASRLGYALVKGDYTQENALITQALQTYGRSGVPLYLVFPADITRPPEILPQVLTLDLVLAALERQAQPAPKP